MFQVPHPLHQTSFPSSQATRSRLAKRRISILAVAAAAALLPQTGFALIWDVTSAEDGTITPGSGLWDTNPENTNWNTGSTSVFWDNDNDAATFAGADAAPDIYEITVGSGLNATTLNFNNTGYILKSATPTTLTLTGTSNTIRVLEGKSATIGTDVTATLAGAMQISGGGTLNITGAVSTTGNSNIMVQGGTTVNVMTGGRIDAGASLVTGPLNGTGSAGTILISGGTVTTTNANGNNGNLAIGNTGGVNGIVTITAGSILIDPESADAIRFGPSSALPEGATLTAVFNLDGGVVETRKVGEALINNEPIAGITSTFNFNGGLLRVNNTPRFGPFMGNLDATYVKQGGAKIDTNGFNVGISQALLHDAALESQADGGLTKTGEGILTLSGVNTYTGPTIIRGGTISTSNLSNDGLGSGLGVSSNASSNLVFDGGTLRYTGNGNFTSERGFTLEAGGGTIDVAHVANGVGLRFAGVVAGSGDLTITRSGSNTGQFFGLSANNTYTGKTFVTNGVALSVRGPQVLGATGSFANGTEVTGATVRLDPSGAGGANRDTTYNEYFTLGEGGILNNFSRSNTVAGNVLLTGNASFTTSTNGGSMTVTGPVELGDNQLTVAPVDVGPVTIEGGLSGTMGSLRKTGEGLLSISGTANIYTGSTLVEAGTLNVSGTLSGTTALSISGGTLQLGAADRINDVASVTMSGGTLDTAGFAENLGSFTLAGTAAIDLGSGASTLRFLDSSGNAPSWNGTLSIRNWSGSLSGSGIDQLFFGSSASGLTGAQLAMIQFIDPAGFEPGTYGAQILPTGEIVAIPEPGTTTLAIVGALGMFGRLGRIRRRPQR